MQAMRCFFAPMEGITGALFRRTHRRFFPGVDRYFMPFLSPSQHHVFTRRELRDILNGLAAPDGRPYNFRLATWDEEGIVIQQSA